MSKLSEYSKFDHLIVDDDDDDDDLHDTTNTHDVRTSPDQSSADTTSTSTVVSSSHEYGIRHVRKYPPTTSATAGTNQSTNLLRFMAQYNGTTVYEWEQSLNEIILYIVSPLPKRGHQLSDAENSPKIICHISATHLQVGIQQPSNNESTTTNTNYYIDEDIYHPIDTKESTWCIEQEDLPPPQPPVTGDTRLCNNKRHQQDVITIYLQKVAKGLVWEAPLRGHNNTGSISSTSSASSDRNHNNCLDPIALQDVQKSLLLERWQEENPGMDFRDATFNGGSIPDPRTYMGGIGYQ